MGVQRHATSEGKIRCSHFELGARAGVRMIPDREARAAVYADAEAYMQVCLHLTPSYLADYARDQLEGIGPALWYTSN